MHSIQSFFENRLENVVSLSPSPEGMWVVFVETLTQSDYGSGDGSQDGRWEDQQEQAEGNQPKCIDCHLPGGVRVGTCLPYTVFNTIDLRFYCVKHNLQRSTVDSIPSPSPPPVCVQTTKTRGGKDQGTKLEVSCLKRKKELRLGGDAPW